MEEEGLEEGLEEEEVEVGEGLNSEDWSGAAKGGWGVTAELVRKRGWLPLSSTLRREKRVRLPVYSLPFRPPTFHPFSLSLALLPLAFSLLLLADPRIPA